MAGAIDIAGIVARTAELSERAGALGPVHGLYHQAASDRRTLLDLLRRIAEMDPVWEVEGRDICVYCGSGQMMHVIQPGAPRDAQGRDHATDCPWPLLEKLKVPR